MGSIEWIQPSGLHSGAHRDVHRTQVRAPAPLLQVWPVARDLPSRSATRTSAPLSISATRLTAPCLFAGRVSAAPGLLIGARRGGPAGRVRAPGQAVSVA
jgi:hypothetical protein